MHNLIKNDNDVMLQNLNKIECIKLLGNNYIGHLAYLSREHPMVVPITYYYNKADHVIICYSVEGNKTRAMRMNKYISFGVDEIASVNHWKSILIVGTFEELKGPDAKYQMHKFANGVKNIMLTKEKRKAHFISEFSSKLDSHGTPIVFKINILEITGRQRNFSLVMDNI
jgi:nitroimidazol reductase NimA-like FMN-containing flavoprotein (pyridoxamine 5'-phosphate oxidase superfamily)